MAPNSPRTSAGGHDRARCTETSSGARNVEKILSRTLLPELSAEVLSRLAEGATISVVTVGVDTAGSFQYSIG